MAVALSALAESSLMGTRRDSSAGHSASTTCGPLIPGRSATLEYPDMLKLLAGMDGRGGDDNTVPQYPHDLPREVELEAIHRYVPTPVRNVAPQHKVSDFLLSGPWAWTGLTEVKSHNVHGLLPTPPQTVSATSVLPDDCRSRNQSTELSSMRQDSLSDDGDVISNHAGASFAHELASNDDPSQYRPYQSITLTQQDVYSPVEFSPPQGSDELSIALQQYIPNAPTEGMRIEQIIQDFKEWRCMFAPKGPATRRYDVTPKLLLKMKFYCPFHPCSHSKTGFSTQYDLRQHEKRRHYQFKYVHKGFLYRRSKSLAYGGSTTEFPYSPSETHSDDSELSREQDLKLEQHEDTLDAEQFPTLTQDPTDTISKEWHDKQFATRCTLSEQEKLSYCTPSTASEDSRDEEMSVRRPESILHELFPDNAALATYLAFALDASSEGDVTLLDRIRSAALPTKQHGGEHHAPSFSTSTVGGATPSSNMTGVTYKTNPSSLGGDDNGGSGEGEQNDPTRPGPSEAGPEAHDEEKRLRCHFLGCMKDYKSYNGLLDHRTKTHLCEGFRCPRCSSSFPTMTELTNHLAQATPRCEIILVEHNTIDQVMHGNIAQEIQKIVTAQWSFADAPDNEMKVWITKNREEFIGSKLISAKTKAGMERDLAKWYITQLTMYPKLPMPPHPFRNLINAASANWIDVVVEQVRCVIEGKRALDQRPPRAPELQDQWYIECFEEGLRVCQAMQAANLPSSRSNRRTARSSTSTRRGRGRLGPHFIVGPRSNNVDNSGGRVQSQQPAPPSPRMANSSSPLSNVTMHADQETPVIDAQYSPMMVAPPLPLALQNAQRQSGERSTASTPNQMPMQQPTIQPHQFSLQEQQQLQTLGTSHGQQPVQAFNGQARYGQIHQAVPQKRVASYPANGQTPPSRRMLNTPNPSRSVTPRKAIQRPPPQMGPYGRQPSWTPITPNSALRLGPYGQDGSQYQSSQVPMTPTPAPRPGSRQQDGYQNQNSQVPLVATSSPHPDVMNPDLTSMMDSYDQNLDQNYEQYEQDSGAQNQSLFDGMLNEGSMELPTEYYSPGEWDTVPEMDAQLDGAIYPGGGPQ